MSEATEVRDARVLRLEGLRASLSGGEGQGVRGRRLRRNGAVNLLTGVWLHAAARAEQGLELTELERGILEPLQEVLGEEVLDIGRVYREQRAAVGVTAVVPQVVASRSLSDGFGLEEYKAALTELLPQITALPNVAVLDRAKLASEEVIDTPEFTAAMADYGFGVTGFTGEGDDDLGVQSAPSFRARLEWAGFGCDEPVGDQGGGRDEIYWTSAANAQGYQLTTRTGEVGEVVGGRGYAIPGDVKTGSKAILDTMINGGCASVLITLFEGDQSNSEWYTALGKALNDATSALQASADFSNFVPGLDLYGHMHTGLGFIAALWEYMRNKDDLVLSRAFALSPADFKAIYEAPDGARWRFNASSNGMGNFLLISFYTGDQPLLGDSRLFTTTTNTDGANWSQDTPLPSGTTSHAPALAAYDNKLFCMVRSPDSTQQLSWNHFNGSSWSSFSPFGQAKSPSTPALAVHNGHLYSTHHSADGDLWWNRFNGTDWSGFTQFPSGRTLTAPALAEYNGTLHCMVRDVDSPALSWTTFNGSTWKRFTAMRGKSPSAPALAAFNGKLFAVHRGSDDALYWTTFNGTAWSDYQKFPSGKTTAAPTLAVHNGNLYCMVRSAGDSTTLWWSIASGSTWTTFTRAGGASSTTAPAAASFNNTLHCVHRG
ncbi:hypothetical protein [Streptomyces sp. NPDC097981]|uniref:hypothetical protein n=1 Tax=Streptomyces sp. NPDC097981 TaxID=3155428 RepID=UPI00331785DF